MAGGCQVSDGNPASLMDCISSLMEMMELKSPMGDW